MRYDAKRQGCGKKRSQGEVETKTNTLFRGETPSRGISRRRTRIRLRSGQRFAAAVGSTATAKAPLGGDLPPQSQARTVAGRSRAWYGRGSQCRRESGRASSLDERGRFRGPGASWRCERGALFPIHSNENTTVLSGKQHQKKARGGNAAPVPAGPRSAPTRSDCEGMVVWLFTSGK